MLRNVPFFTRKLVKSRVSAVKGFARVGFKIRANPNNDQSLTSMIAMIAVPPDVDGGNCKMSRKGGNWDELKRTVSWYVQSLKPGEALEIQAQFPFIEGNSRVPKFPVLVKCEYPFTFSNISVSNKDDRVRLKQSTSGGILHRKV
jgi:hypothetical protein